MSVSNFSLPLILPKVMEVLQESLEPALMEAEIRWQPPPGYSLVDYTPKSLGVVYSQQTCQSFAFLRKNSNLSSPMTNGVRGDVRTDSSLSPATLVGHLVGGKEVQLPIRQAIVPPLNAHQSQELTYLLTQMGHWSKIEELEILRLQANSRKNSVEEEEGGKSEEEPSSPKKPRLNGEIATLDALPTATELQDDMVKLSLSSGISCTYTYFKGQGGRNIIQLLPYHQQFAVQRTKNGITPHQIRVKETRKRPSSRHSIWKQQYMRRHQWSPSPSTSSPTSVVASTISAVGNSFMSLVSNVFHTSSLGIKEGKTLEDELELQKRKGKQLYWDESKNEIKYPQSYYKPTPSGSGRRQKTTALALATTKSSKHAPRVSHEKVVRASSINGHCKSSHHRSTGQFLFSSVSDSIHSPPSTLLYPSHTSSSSSHQNSTTTMDNNSSSSSDDEEDDMTISDSESDSSLDLDWEALPKTREYMPIIQMQLFSGAWPILRGFSYAIRVPLSEIRLLPLSASQTDKWSSNPQSTSNGSSVPRTCLPSSQDIDDESNAHFWSTALAVVCFKECFPELEKEWKLIVAKSERWMERNLDQCGLGMDQVYTKSRELLFRNNSS